MNHADTAAKLIAALTAPHAFDNEDIELACALAQVHALLAIAEGLDRLKRPTGRGPR